LLFSLKAFYSRPTNNLKYSKNLWIFRNFFFKL
jgi:hypothetical protein